MITILLSLIVCVVAVIVLLHAKPNLFIFQLIETVFGKKAIRKD